MGKGKESSMKRGSIFEKREAAGKRKTDRRRETVLKLVFFLPFGHALESQVSQIGYCFLLIKKKK